MKSTKFIANSIKLLTVLFFLVGASFAEAKMNHSGKKVNRGIASLKHHKAKAKMASYKKSAKKKQRRHH